VISRGVGTERRVGGGNCDTGVPAGRTPDEWKEERMKSIIIALVLAISAVVTTPIMAFDYSFSDQSYSDQENGQDNLCYVDGVKVPC
jgi:hypothetical protein